MERMATDKQQWRSLVDGLCSQRANWHNEMNEQVIVHENRERNIAPDAAHQI